MTVQEATQQDGPCCIIHKLHIALCDSARGHTTEGFMLISESCLTQLRSHKLSVCLPCYSVLAGECMIIWVWFKCLNGANLPHLIAADTPCHKQTVALFLILKVLFVIHQSLALLLYFSLWAKHGMVATPWVFHPEYYLSFSETPKLIRWLAAWYQNSKPSPPCICPPKQHPLYYLRSLSTHLFQLSASTTLSLSSAYDFVSNAPWTDGFLKHDSSLLMKRHCFWRTDLRRTILYSHSIHIVCVYSEYEIVLPWFQQSNPISAGITAMSNYNREAWYHMSCLLQAYCHLSTNADCQLADRFGKTYGITKNGCGRRKNCGNHEPCPEPSIAYMYCWFDHKVKINF